MQRWTARARTTAEGTRPGVTAPGVGISWPLVIPGTLRFSKSRQNGKVLGLDADKNAQKLAICPYVAD
jgi:hypothetical protein